MSTSTNLNIVLHPYCWSQLIDENWFPVSVFVPFLLANLREGRWFAKYIFWHDREPDSETAVWTVWTVWVGWPGRRLLNYIKIYPRQSRRNSGNCCEDKHWNSATFSLLNNKRQRHNQTMRKNPAIFAKFISLQVKYYTNFLLQTRHFWQDKVLINDQSDKQNQLSWSLFSPLLPAAKPRQLRSQLRQKGRRGGLLI